MPPCEARTRKDVASSVSVQRRTPLFALPARTAPPTPRPRRSRAPRAARAAGRSAHGSACTRRPASKRCRCTWRSGQRREARATASRRQPRRSRRRQRRRRAPAPLWAAYWGRARRMRCVALFPARVLLRFAHLRRAHANAVRAACGRYAMGRGAVVTRTCLPGAATTLRPRRRMFAPAAARRCTAVQRFGQRRV